MRRDHAGRFAMVMATAGSMRGFLMFELLIALATASMAISGILLLAFAVPRAVASARQEIRMLDDLSQIFTEALGAAMNGYPDVASLSSSTADGTVTLSLLPREDEYSRMLRATASWVSGFSVPHTAMVQTVVSDPLAVLSVPPQACDPFVSEDWTHIERIATYEIGGGRLPMPAVSPSAYSLSDAIGTPASLVATAASTSGTGAPAVLFFAAENDGSLAYAGGFDNAAGSRMGFSGVAVSGNAVFAANAFGSASTSTCADGLSCAQVQVFSGIGIDEGTGGSEGRPQRVSVLSLATTSPPFALSRDGASAPASAIAYYRGYLYLGLQKTPRGDEFNIIDAHDPARLVWRSGYRIGRTVRSITVRGRYAYVSTADPARELIVFDIRDAGTPKVAGVWDAPGSTAFGYGAAVTAFPGLLRFGRTYVSNAPELEIISLSDEGSTDRDGAGKERDIGDTLRIAEEAQTDLGTPSDPESVRDLLTQDWLTFALLTHRLTLWQVRGVISAGPATLVPYGMPYELPSGFSGAALACRNNLIYLARNGADGTGYIDVLRGASAPQASR